MGINFCINILRIAVLILYKVILAVKRKPKATAQLAEINCRQEIWGDSMFSQFLRMKTQN